MATRSRGHGRTNKDDSGMVTADAPNWPSLVFDKLREFDVRHVTYVPDSGHARLIELCHAANEMKPTVLTTEEEGIGILAGACGVRCAMLVGALGFLLSNVWLVFSPIRRLRALPRYSICF